ncbi:MAG: FkbM family methyltransferase [Chloroflexi bacterium]|nr:FkbM family methyltransferase [Chloroflexota bacterium]
MNGRRLAVSLLDRTPRSALERLSERPRLKRMLRTLVNRAVPAERIVVTVGSGGAEGLRLLIDPRCEKFYWTGGHEPHIQDALSARLRPGMRFWDVGSHIGYFALQAARIVGATGCVLAFEPMPGNGTRLRRNIELNAAENVTVVARAVAAQTGAMRIARTDAGIASTFTWTLEESPNDVERRMVDVTTLDAMVGEHGIPDLVKVDAEGTEVDVLRGAVTLRAAGVPFLVEFTDDAKLREAESFMPEYDFVLLADNHYMVAPAR